MHLHRGSRVGPYEILDSLGGGGMGRVWRARDTRLGRTVAIKVISGDVTRDPKLRLRFEREAKAISQLNHPHICALYDVGEMHTSEGESSPYLVMEYLEGQTLSHRLRSGPLPFDQVLRYGIEIAGALAVAHRHQIIHRDLKPSNIMLTKSGARLLDFGLAKTVRGNGEAVSPRDAPSSGPTDEMSLTESGSMVGTLEYISPEQLEGKDPDTRTDIFALGVCLYEMITARRPFRGSTRASVMAAILERDPEPLSKFRADVPAHLEWLVRSCLAKDPDERMQTAHDVALELRHIQEVIPATNPRRRGRWPLFVSLAAAGVVVIASAAIIATTKSRKTPLPQARRLTLILPPGAPVAPHVVSGDYEKLAASPDSRHLAYIGGVDPPRLYLYSLQTSETKPLPHTEHARGPFFSPDGEWIGFYTIDGVLKKIRTTGGEPVTLSRNRDLRGATWGLDDSIYFAEISSPLQKISASGGTPEPLTSRSSQVNVLWPTLLPGGQHILYTANDIGSDYDRARLMVLSLKDGSSKVVLSGATYGRYSRSGHLLFFRSGVLWTVPFDLRNLRVTGSPGSLVSDVDSYYARGLAQFVIADDGSLFYLPTDPSDNDSELVWVDRAGSVTPITSLRRPYDDPRLSPDGKRILVTVGGGPSSDLWIYDLTRNAWSRLTTEATNLTGLWSPDGREIVFASSRDGGFNVYVTSSDGGSPPRRLTARPAWVFPSTWSPDGTIIATVEWYRPTLTDIYMVRLERPDPPTPFRVTPFDEHGSAFSPDGEWLAYQSTESGQYEVYLQEFPGPGRKWTVSTDGGTVPEWRRDGRELFYRRGDAMMAVTVAFTPELTLSEPRLLFTGDYKEDYDVGPDGKRFLMVRRPKPLPRTQINVVLNGLRPGQ